MKSKPPAGRLNSVKATREVEARTRQQDKLKDNHVEVHKVATNMTKWRKSVKCRAPMQGINLTESAHYKKLCVRRMQR